jgi:ABC-2 type transport system ATP-binding protein
LLDLTHRYGRAASLEHVSLRVRPGDRYGFLGHNGAGKTTTMRIALGLTRARSGRVIVDGIDAAKAPREARARLGGMIEITGFHTALSGRSNLHLLAGLQGIARRRRAAEVDRVLELVGLCARADRAVTSYSQGMRQRLGLAQALLGEPRYVLLDEPTNGLDPEGIAEFRDALLRLGEHGTTVLLSSHQLTEVARLCNRIGILQRGRLLIEAETARLLAAEDARYEIVADPAALGALAERAGLRVLESGPARSLVALDGRPPARVLAELCQAGLSIDAFAPRPWTLEEVYLRAGEGTLAADTPPPVALDPSIDAERRAPRAPILRVAGYELKRHLRWPVLALLCAPAAMGALRVVFLRQHVDQKIAEVEAGKLISTADVSGYFALTHGYALSIAALAVLVVALASQSLAGEFASGTLRNVLLRPATRAQVVLGKASAHAVLCLGAAAVGSFVNWIATVSLFAFGDSYERTKGDPESSLLIAKEDVAPQFVEALLSPSLPLLALAGVGFLAGALTSRSVVALGLALALGASVDLARDLPDRLHLDPWLPTTYLPSLRVDNTSFLDYFGDLALGAMNAAYHFGGQAAPVAIAWIVGALALATAVLSRRTVP